MKTKNKMKPLARLIATSLAVGGLAGFGGQVLAQTAAGTLIKNLATVSYQDENGNEYTAQSNEAVVTVAPVYSGTIEGDNSLSASAGQTVYFPHTLSNTGNIADTYTVTADAGVVYLDKNNNGQPDDGEPIVTGTVSVAAGEQANFVVALPIPTNAADKSTLTSTLTAVSSNGAVVADLGDNSDSTNATQGNGTNFNTAIVSTGPVLVLNKSSVHNEALGTVTYTLTVKNNGGSDAVNVNIVDALPEVETDTNNDGVKELVQVPLEGTITVNGLENTPDDVKNTLTVPGLESNLGDLNFDGDATDSLDIVLAKDAILPANTTVTVVYTVKYDKTWEAGADVNNTFIAFEDVDGDGNPDDPATYPDSTSASSNTTHDVIPQIFAVAADDTGLGALNGTNDGGDDDGDVTTNPLNANNNDSQLVDVAATGATVKFKHVITNDGNGDDTFNLKAVSDGTDGFPAGTVFTFWDSTGTVKLTDSDDDGVPDTGVIDSGESLTIMVKAKLPAAVSGTPTNGYNATLTATSSNDPDPVMSTPTEPGSIDQTSLKLGSITAATVDIVDTNSPQGLVGFNDAGVANAQVDAPAMLKTATLNSEVVFDLKLANESGNSDSFRLEAPVVPEGWDVVFKDLSGNIITSTTLIPANGEFVYKAYVTVPADPSQAKSDAEQSNATVVDGYDNNNDGITPATLTDADGDNDYIVKFTATSSSNSAVTDTVTNAIDVEAEREVVITPDGQNQIQPGGTVDFDHKLENNGNQTEVLELGAENTKDGWTTVIKIDTNGDGVADTILSNLAPGTPTSPVTIKGIDDQGNLVDIEVTDVDGDGIPELNLEPGENVEITTTVTAPSNAPLGSVDESTITVTAVDPDDLTNAEVASAQDQTTVMLGQVRLDKKSAIDSNCDGIKNVAPAVGSAFLATQTAQVKPGECIIWRLTATNEGNAKVKEVVISDAAPEFTDIVDGILKFCHGNGCTPVGAAPGPGNAPEANYSAGLVNFTVGELVAGQQATGEFTVKVQ